MVNNFSPNFSMIQKEAKQLDSTKRCLFPAENQSSLWEATEPSCDPTEGDDQYIGLKAPEETRNSPISVVCVLSSDRATSNPNKHQNDSIIPASLSSSSFSFMKHRLSCGGGVEEQTVIEVQYVEAGDQDRDVDRDRELAGDDDTNTPIRQRCAEKALNKLTNISSEFEHVRARPLLDIERTPLKSRAKMSKNAASTPLFGCDSDAYLPICDGSGHELVERTITDFLEDNSVSTPDTLKTVCTDWQAWSYFGFGSRKTQNSCSQQNPSKENIRSVLRRRTSHSLRVRKSNVKQLKQNIAPFALSPARSPARAPGLFRNRSFSVSEHRSAIVRVSKDKKQSKRSFTDVLHLCTMYENVDLDSPDLLKKQSNNKFNDDDLSYDSDPEDFMRRRLTSGRKATDANNDSLFFKESQNLGCYHNYMSSPSRALLDVHNDEMFSNIVQEIFNQTTTLVLHPLLPTNKPRSVQSVRPTAVDAWLERGQHLAYALIQPKWIWKAKPRLDAEGQCNLRQKFRLQGIELLDITRILKVEDTEGEMLSFGKPSHCFFIKSIHDEEFCFEAKSTTERDRVVSSLKLLIARFGAKVLTGDPQVYYDFFWINDAVPGKAPDLHEALVENANGFR